MTDQEKKLIEAVEISMTEQEKKVIEAAEIIKEYCESFKGNCNGCMFDEEYSCIVCNFPDNWIIPRGETE